MNNDEWNRKDKAPKDTVDFIQKILIENGVKTKIVDKLNFKDKWFSNRIEFSNINGKGTNGKGISEEFALASGYAEFMERLQSRMLFDGMYPNKSKKSRKILSDSLETKKIMNRYFNNYLIRNNIDKTNIDDLLKIRNNQYCELSNYFNVFKKRIEQLPDKFIFSICGSNGLCSGNTKIEAFNQGLCEVFERYVNYKLYHDKNIIFPIIPKKAFQNLYSYSLIEELEKKGYTVYIKDCTLNGVFPVLGILVINRSKSKYSFRLGSDINPDICLQRCVTEMFQGLDINTTFRLQMNEIENNFFVNFWELSDMEMEYYKNVRVGSGHLPRNIFINEQSDNKALEPFIFKKISNKDVSNFLIDIVRQEGGTLFVKDYSYLGFPTLRVYVTNMSEIIDYSNGLIETQTNLSKIKELLLIEKDTKKLVAELAWRLKYLSNSKLIESNFCLTNLLGISLNDSYNGLLKKNLFYIIAVLSLYLHQYDDALKYIDIYHTICSVNQRNSKFENIIFEAIKNNINKDKLLQYFDTILIDKERENISNFVNYLYDINMGKFEIPICRDCNNCSLDKFCCVSE